MAAVLMDTSFIIALENTRDPYHEIAARLDRDLNARAIEYVSHWAVLLEIGDGYARRNRRRRGEQLLANFDEYAQYRICPINDNLFLSAKALYMSRPDKEWGLTDCVSFVLMEREGIKEALTADPHFRQAGFVPLLLEPA